MTRMTLPRSPEALERLAHKRAAAKLGWYVHAFFFALVNLVLLALSSLGFGSRPWSVFPFLGWGLGLALHGAADMGIVGKDILMEHGGAALYEPLDLNIARCRLSVAAPKGFEYKPGKRLRVATKYPEITKRHYAARGEQVEIIKLYGSMELAPLVGLADVIVDLVATGKTLVANGLVEIERVCEVTSRLVVNKAAMKMKHARIQALLDQFAQTAA